MDVKNILKKAKDFHGHVCPFLALGVRASQIAMEELGISRVGLESIGEDVLAVVECNNCFADGVQVATGCTFGNNSLIYLDVGKNAFTLVRRRDWEGVRVYVDADKVSEMYFSEDVEELFRKVVVRREASKEEEEKLAELWEEIGWKIIEAPREIFKIERVRFSPIERAPIFESVKCNGCGELVMKTRIKDGLCLKCRGEFYGVVGRGIVKFSDSKFEEVI